MIEHNRYKPLLCVTCSGQTYRNNRNNCEQFGTCSEPSERNERNTPLWGVTLVRMVDRVPMPPYL